MGETGEQRLLGVKGSSPASHELALTVLPVTSEGRGLPRVPCLGPVLPGGVWAEAERAGKTALSSRRLPPAEAWGGGRGAVTGAHSAQEQAAFETLRVAPKAHACLGPTLRGSPAPSPPGPASAQKASLQHWDFGSLVCPRTRLWRERKQALIG